MSVRGVASQAGSVYKLIASAIPFIIAPTGTMANNGAITLGTALPTTYANAYIQLPANAIQAGSGAGWYFCQMSSATAGTVFNNTYTTGVPTIPASPAAFVSTGPGAYTGVTTSVTGQQIAIPAGALGANGALRLTLLFSVSANTDTKTVSATIAGVQLFGVAATTAGQFGSSSITTILNRGANNSNIVFQGSASGLGFAGSALTFSTINFAAAQSLNLNALLAVATDFTVLEAFMVEILPG